MTTDQSGDKLDRLFAEYREACPDPEAGAGFMPGLWQRIDARRASNVVMLRRIAQVCVGATLALTLLMGAVLIPRFERAPVYSTTYVDTIAADHPNTYVDILTGDIK
ncbi:MAG: hypothetical protein LAO79_11140 [Acidobacteriia bacterium]|nr:hypothetical protein [Terriglobia bacterium]